MLRSSTCTLISYQIHYKILTMVIPFIIHLGEDGKSVGTVFFWGGEKGAFLKMQILWLLLRSRAQESMFLHCNQDGHPEAL